jgi:hypothetical protein
VKLESRGESWGDGLLNGDLSISVFFTGDEMPVRKEEHRVTGACSAVSAYLPYSHHLQD